MNVAKHWHVAGRAISDCLVCLKVHVPMTRCEVIRDLNTGYLFETVGH